MQSSPGLSQGIFVNAPDNYFAAGANKDMFYGDPSNSRRARLLDIVLLRQMLYDASFEWLTTQGWSFVPIDNYDGGGPEVQFAPLEVNAADYDLAWAMHMGYGVSGVCWRGTRFFDGPKSKAIVTGWIHFYKKYRQTLTNGGLVHVRRPDGQGLDAILHTNLAGGPSGERGILFVFNPTLKPITTALRINLYYTGLNDTAEVLLHDDGSPELLRLARDYSVRVQLTVAAGGYSWFAIRDGHKG